MRKSLGLIILLIAINALRMNAQYLLAGNQLGFYHDFTPDTTMSILWANYNGTFAFDLESDNINDVQIELHSHGGTTSSGKYCKIVSLNPKFKFYLRRIDASGYKVLRYYSASDTIKFDVDTLSGGYLFADGWSTGFPSWSFNDWVNLGDKYLGIMYVNGTNIEYGWMRLNVNSLSVTLKDFDINSSIAGIYSNEKSKVKIYPNPALNTISISNYDGSLFNEAYSINNSLGQIIKVGEIKSTVEQIDLSDIKAGFYYLCIPRKGSNTKFTKE